jgi:glycosyltransferase involved in cell wall biosynthesis
VSQTKRLLVGRDMLCFSHDWTGDPLSKTHLMRLLARENRVLWVNSIGYRNPNLAAKKDLSRAFTKLTAAIQPVRQAEPNLYVMSPLVIPAWGQSWVQSFNKRFLTWQVWRVMRNLRFHQPINWIFNPAASILARELGEDKVIYYCVDEYTAFSGVNRERLLQLESELLNKADAVFVSAEALLHTKKSPRVPTELIRHGVDYEHFRKALSEELEVHPLIKNLPKPIIGYFGLIAEDWVDVPLLVQVAQAFPQASIVLLGKSTMNLDALSGFSNVHILGRQPYESLPAFSKGFDVALIPFPISEVTLNANPLKAREYLAAGLPVVSTSIPEVEVLGECRIGRTPSEYIAEIRNALKSPGPNKERSLRMESESWSARLNWIDEHLQKAFQTPRTN